VDEAGLLPVDQRPGSAGGATVSGLLDLDAGNGRECLQSAGVEPGPGNRAGSIGLHTDEVLVVIGVMWRTCPDTVPCIKAIDSGIRSSRLARFLLNQIMS